MKKLSLDLRVSQILGVRFLSGLVLWLIFMSLGSQIAIKVGHRERCHAWDDLRKVKAEIGSNKRGGYSDTRSLSLLLIFKGRTYRLATDEYVTELTKFQHYCQSKIRNRRKKAKKSK